MKRNILISLLFVSIVFNISFVSIYVYKTINFRRNGFNPPPPPFERQKMRPERDPHFKEYKLKNMELRKDFFEVLSQEPVKTEELKAITEKLLRSQAEMESLLVNHFIQLRGEMDRDEADKFFKKLCHRSDESCARIKNKQNESWRKK